MKLGVLFSGGKDSSYACYRAMEGEEVTCLITVSSRNPDSYMFHTPNIRWTRLQAEAAGLPLVEVMSAGEKEVELDDLRRALFIAHEEYGVEGVVTGAILSVYQASRIQKICKALDLWCFNPLWHTDQEAYMSRLLKHGFQVIISGVFSAPFDEFWLGKEINKGVLSDLLRFSRTYGITLTGEGGEYETFTCDAPFFRNRIEILNANVEYHNFHGRYEITEAQVIEK